MKPKITLSLLFIVVAITTVAIFYIFTTPETRDALFYVNVALSLILLTITLFAIRNTKVWGTTYNTQSIAIAAKILKYVATMAIIMVIYGIIGANIAPKWYYITLAIVTIINAFAIFATKYGADVQVENETKIKELNDTKKVMQRDFNRLSVEYKIALQSLTISDTLAIDTERAITSLIQTIKALPLNTFTDDNNPNDSLDTVYNSISDKIKLLSTDNNKEINEAIVLDIKHLCSSTTTQLRLLK